MRASFSNKWQGLGSALPFLLLCDALAVLALSAGNVAVSWWIVTKGGAAHLSVFGIAAALTMLIALPLMSALGDRHAKSRLMAWGLLAAVITALGLALMASMSVYRIELIIAIYAIDVIAFAVVMPAVSTIAADLVPADRLADALGLQKSAQSLGRLMGPVMGGAVVALGSVSLGLWVYSVMLTVAALSAFAIPAIAHTSRVARAHWSEEVRAGLRAKWRVPIDRNWTIYAFVTMLFLFPAIGMLLPVKVHSLSLGAHWLGAIEAALGLGMLLGAFWGAPRVIFWLGRFRACMVAIVVSAVAITGVALGTQGWVLVLGFGIAGFSMSVSQLVGQTHRALAVPDHFRARFASVNIMVMQVAAMLGPAIAGVALGMMEVSAVYTGFGLSLLLVTLAFPLVPGIRHFLALDHGEVKGWYGRQHPAVFGLDGVTVQRGLP